ncbi:MAG TPA: sigma-54 dependent transcriptional regulator [Vicinamibacterales bacterium]
MPRILVVDDDRDTCRIIAEVLAAPGREFELASESERAVHLARTKPFDLVICDINLNSSLNGLDVLRAFKGANPDGQVLLISGFGTLQTAIEAVRAGAFDYISKPFDIEEVKKTAQRALDQGGTVAVAHVPGVDLPPGEELIGRTPAMLAVYKQIARAADSVVPVLIVGESGTGKELVARALHRNSQRGARPFVAINCGAITETLLESELFGHSRGAFTGAVADAKGIFEQAQGGTVFLDEIGETSPALQVKLLRVLEEGEVRPVGGSRPIKVDNRVVAATNRDLERAVAEQQFRADLYYRLSVIVIRLPALKERREDIPLLVSAFLKTAWKRIGRQVELSAGALDVLLAHDWPGNVRQLENTIERIVMFSPGSVVGPDDLPTLLQSARRDTPAGLFEDLPTLEEVERRYIEHVLQAVRRNRTRAADVLGIDRRTLYRMADRYGIKLSDEPEDK